MDIILVFIFLLLIDFIVSSILYSKFGLFKEFFHDKLEWHEPIDKCGFNGISITSKCKYCGEEIMQDSQGNWFLDIREDLTEDEKQKIREILE